MITKKDSANYFGEKRKILVVDDEAKNRDFLGSVLRNEYDLTFAVNGTDALEKLDALHESLSLVLLDLNMPELGGLEVLSKMRASNELENIPVIMMTSDHGAEEACLRLGANDFIPKPYPYSGVIGARVQKMIELFESKAIVHSTQRDPMTGLYSRDYFLWAVKEHDLHHPDLAMDAIVIDINKFHIINERFGVKNGNNVIKQLAAHLRKISIENDGIVCRRIADTFLYYCPHVTDVVAFYNELSKGIDPKVKDSVHIRIGIYPNVDKEGDVLTRFNQAKIASDSVKNNRNNSIGIYDKSMHDKQRYHERLLDDFSDAIAKEQFVVYYQPKFDVRFSNPELFSAEALVRWEHPEYGRINPMDFIPLLEANGLIYRLDRYVWERAAAQIKTWKASHGITLPVSVNMSRIDMFEPDVTTVLEGILKKYELSPADLLIEVTESAYAQDFEYVAATAKALRAKGFRIEMDDFGTGYSSLSMLSSLPIDALKLDMHLVQNSIEKKGDTRILEIIVDIADYLSIPVIAEGVENANQLNLLKAIGCDYVQGYYFSKPVLPEEIEPMFGKYVKREEEHALSFNSVYTKTKRRALSFTKVATALFSGYESVVFVDLKTGQFVEYRQSESRKKLHHNTSGNSFFEDICAMTENVLPPEDHEKLRSVLDRKEEILKSMSEKSFSMFYRFIEDGKPIWHFLRAVLSKDKEYLAIGILSVQDAFNELPCQRV